MKAFPVEFYGREEGMDLRDYFAAKALPILLNANSKPWDVNFEFYAEQAYRYADAMMKAREQT